MANSTNIYWNSFSPKEKKRFLKENSLPFVSAATNAIRFDTRYSAVCMVCAVQALGIDALVQSEDILLQSINRALGKQFGKPTKQDRHNKANKHEVGHFCDSQVSVAKTLLLWLYGLVQIGGQYRTASEVWTVEKLKDWITKNGQNTIEEKEVVRKTVPLFSDEKEKLQSQSRKRVLSDFFQGSSKKKKITSKLQPE